MTKTTGKAKTLDTSEVDALVGQDVGVGQLEDLMAEHRFRPLVGVHLANVGVRMVDQGDVVLFGGHAQVEVSPA